MYHPGIEQHAVVAPEAVAQYRQSGWLLASEHEANQADEAARVEAVREADEKAAKHPAARSTHTKGDE